MDQLHSLPPLPSVEELFAPTATLQSPNQLSAHLPSLLSRPPLPPSTSLPPLPPLDIPPAIPHPPSNPPFSPVPPQPTSPLVDSQEFAVGFGNDASLKRSADLISSETATSAICNVPPPAKKSRCDVLRAENPVKDSPSSESLEDGEISDESEEEGLVDEDDKSIADYELRPAYLSSFNWYGASVPDTRSRQPVGMSLTSPKNFKQGLRASSAAKSSAERLPTHHRKGQDDRHSEHRSEFRTSDKLRPDRDSHVKGYGAVDHRKSRTEDERHRCVSKNESRTEHRSRHDSRSSGRHSSQSGEVLPRSLSTDSKISHGSVPKSLEKRDPGMKDYRKSTPSEAASHSVGIGKEHRRSADVEMKNRLHTSYRDGKEPSRSSESRSVTLSKVPPKAMIGVPFSTPDEVLVLENEDKLHPEASAIISISDKISHAKPVEMTDRNIFVDLTKAAPLVADTVENKKSTADISSLKILQSIAEPAGQIQTLCKVEPQKPSESDHENLPKSSGLLVAGKAALVSDVKSQDAILPEKKISDQSIKPGSSAVTAGSKTGATLVSRVTAVLDAGTHHGCAAPSSVPEHQRLCDERKYDERKREHRSSSATKTVLHSHRRSSNVSQRQNSGTDLDHRALDRSKRQNSSQSLDAAVTHGPDGNHLVRRSSSDGLLLPHGSTPVTPSGGKCSMPLPYPTRNSSLGLISSSAAGSTQSSSSLTSPGLISSGLSSSASGNAATGSKPYSSLPCSQSGTDGLPSSATAGRIQANGKPAFISPADPRLSNSKLLSQQDSKAAVPKDRQPGIISSVSAPDLRPNDLRNSAADQNFPVTSSTSAVSVGPPFPPEVAVPGPVATPTASASTTDDIARADAEVRRLIDALCASTFGSKNSREMVNLVQNNAHTATSQSLPRSETPASATGALSSMPQMNTVLPVPVECFTASQVTEGPERVGSVPMAISSDDMLQSRQVPSGTSGVKLPDLTPHTSGQSQQKTSVCVPVSGFSEFDAPSIDARPAAAALSVRLDTPSAPELMDILPESNAIKKDEKLSCIIATENDAETSFESASSFQVDIADDEIQMDDPEADKSAGNTVDESSNLDLRGNEYEIIDDLESGGEDDANDDMALSDNDEEVNSDVDSEYETILDDMSPEKDGGCPVKTGEENQVDTSDGELNRGGRRKRFGSNRQPWPMDDNGEFQQPVVHTKIVLVERGRDPFDILPEGWIIISHLSGMPVYLHKQLRVCTLSRPYFLGPGSARKHNIPLSSLPCLQYRRAMEELAASKTAAEQPPATADEPASSAPADQPGVLSEEQLAAGTSAKSDAEPAEASETSVSTATDKPSIPAVATNPTLKAKVESVEDHKQRSLRPLELRDYCQRLFEFRALTVRRFRRWKDRRKHNTILKKASRPVLLPTTKLITCPLPTHQDVPNTKRKEFVFNPAGKSHVCILHEYAQHTMRTHPRYEFQELEDSEKPYSATVIINDLKYGIGYASSKKSAKLEAARITLGILIPEMNKVLNDDKVLDLHDLSFFDDIKIRDPRVTDLCVKSGQPTPYQVLCECLKRNFGMGDTQVQMDVRRIKHQRSEFTMRVGKHETKVICKNKREGKQLAAQAILHLMHPQLTTWGSLLRLYSKTSEFKEKKEEEHSVTELQTKAHPNKEILNKLRLEMGKLYKVQDAVKMNIRGTLNFRGPDIQSTELGGVTL